MNVPEIVKRGALPALTGIIALDGWPLRWLMPSAALRFLADPITPQGVVIGALVVISVVTLIMTHKGDA